MAIPGTIPLSGLLASNAYTDGYPIIDPNFGIGGLREVPLQVDRDTIPPGRQRLGMIVYVQSSASYFQLLTTGSTSLGSVTSSTSPNGGATQYLTNSNWQVAFTNTTASGSYVLTAQTSSMTVLSSSYATTASYALNAQSINTASFVQNSQTSSMSVASSSVAVSSSYSVTASYFDLTPFSSSNAVAITSLSQSIQADLTALDSGLVLLNSKIQPLTISTISSSYVLSSDYTVLVDATSGSVVVFLSTSSLNNQKLYNVKRVDFAVGNHVNVVCNTNDVIYYDTVTGSVQLVPMGAVTFQSDGINHRWIAI